MSWKDDILNAMSEETFFDCHLIGNDGISTPCSKVFLAAQSPYFKTLLFGDFKEHESGLCHLNYPSSIIRVVVKFCHSGDVDLNLILDEVGLRETEIALLVELRDAGRYFQLDNVVASAEKEIADVVFRNRDVKCACVVLATLMSRGEDEGPFWDVFFRYVIENPMPCFCPDFKFKGSTCIASFHPAPHLLARVLEEINDNYVIVRCIQAWAAQESSLGQMSTETDQESLKAVSKRVDFKSLSTLQLSKIQPCTFFPADRILEAYAHHGSLSNAPVTRLDLSSVVYVSVAGEKGLEGFYEPHPYIDNQFCKRGEYDGVPCRYEITFSSTENRWSISVHTDAQLGHHQNSPKVRGTNVLYLNSASLSQNLPFNDWKCVEGTEPAPLVTTLDRWSEQKTASDFRFGGRFGGSADYSIPASTEEHAFSSLTFAGTAFGDSYRSSSTRPSSSRFSFGAAASPSSSSLYSFRN